MFLNIEKSDNEIAADILREVPEKYQKSVGFLLWDYTMALAKGVFKKNYDYIAYICGFGDIYNFDYDDLVKFVFQRRGITAKTASKASGVLYVVGSSTIVRGSLFETPSGAQFQSLETKTITEKGAILAECLVAGVEGNVPAGTITIIPVTIVGIVSVTNPEAFKGGYDKETKESIIERYLEDIQCPIANNNKYHYIKWARECTGVGNVKIKPLWDGENTVKVVIVNDSGEVADEELVARVQNYIDPYELVNDVKVGWGCGNGQAPIGAYCTVESAMAKKLRVGADIKLKAGMNLAEVKENIRATIQNYLKTTVFKDTYISYARIGACILEAEGVLDYENLKLNSASDNILLIDTDIIVEIGVLNKLSVNEVV